MRAEKLKVIKEVLGRSYSSGEETLFLCPFCNHHKRKFSVNIDKGVYKFWVCDKSGRNLGYIVRKFGDRQARDEWSKWEDQVEITDFDFLFSEPETPSEQRINLPEGFCSLATREPPEGASEALKYLSKRGVDKEDILKWKIGFCKEGEWAGRIIVPSFNTNGWANYYVARSWGKEWPRYKNPPASRNIVFNELYVDWEDDIVIVEGVFDAIKAGNGIPLLGSTLRPTSKLFEAIVRSKQKVFLALDADAADKERKLANLLISYNIPVYKIDTTGYEDVGDMTKEIFTKRRKEATIIEKDNYLLQRLMQI